MHWNGIRPIHEVWSSTIDLRNLSDAGDALGSAIMKELATASFNAGPLRDHANLVEAVDLATMNLEVRVAARRQELTQENDAFIATRRVVVRGRPQAPAAGHSTKTLRDQPASAGSTQGDPADGGQDPQGEGTVRRASCQVSTRQHSLL